MVQDPLEELPPAQRLALSYAPARAREATLGLLALDARLATVMRRKVEPMIAQIRLAWWRDILAAEPASWPKGDAVLELLCNWRDPAGLRALVDGWEALLAENLDSRAIDEFARGRGEAFALLAAELGVADAPAARQGRLWALGDLAANLSNPDERAALIETARLEPPVAVLPRALRPLAVLSGLARRSLAHGGAPLLDGPRAMLLAMRLGIAGR
jgi:phytoene synthase